MCKLSPLLFIVNINRVDGDSPVDKGVSAGSSKINCLLFADNLILLASSQHVFSSVLSKKFYSEQMFVLVHLQLCNHADTMLQMRENEISLRKWSGLHCAVAHLRWNTGLQHALHRFSAEFD